MTSTKRSSSDVESVFALSKYVCALLTRALILVNVRCNSVISTVNTEKNDFNFIQKIIFITF